MIVWVTTGHRHTRHEIILLGMLGLGLISLAISAAPSDPEPVTWRFVGCASDQPDDAPDGSGWNGDGNTTHDCLVAAGTLVPPRMRVPAGSVVMGRPAKVIRKLTDGDREHIRTAGLVYVATAAEYNSSLAAL